MKRRVDREALERLYDRHIWRVYGFFGYRVSSVADAEDLTQQTFERAMRAWPSYDPSRAAESTWLLAIARNLLIDHYRREGSRRERESPDGVSEDLQATLVGDHPLSAELAVALSRLDSRQQELIALRFGGDMTGPEIADLTGLTLSNVQQILSRSLRQLRGRLEEVGGRTTAA